MNRVWIELLEAIKVLEEVLNFTKDTETKQFVARKIQELLEQNDLIKL